MVWSIAHRAESHVSFLKEDLEAFVQASLLIGGRFSFSS